MDTHQAVSSSPLTGLSWISQVLSMTARVASPGNNEVPCPRALRLLQAIAATAVGGLLTLRGDIWPCSATCIRQARHNVSRLNFLPDENRRILPPSCKTALFMIDIF
ncbi:hypothetical protein [Halomonas sp. THAF12]|uniref:hypothetical protein n=1 Tax=Halomonas sp. THAF12 TaxID=2587849 RepID=UPI00126835A3|nr:hypothetical protein [Halomonas sp. THAF12]